MLLCRSLKTRKVHAEKKRSSHRHPRRQHPEGLRGTETRALQLSVCVAAATTSIDTGGALTQRARAAGSWPQALSILAAPENVPTALGLLRDLSLIHI